MYYTTQPMPGGLPETQLHFDRHGYLRDPHNHVVRARAVFVRFYNVTLLIVPYRSI